MFFRGSKSIKNRYRFCTTWLVGLEEEIIDKDFTHSYWLALQFWVQPNRIFTVGVPQASHEIIQLYYRKLQTISPSPGVGLNDELLGHSSGQSFLRHIFNELFILESGKNQCRNQNFLNKKCFAYHYNKSVSCLESCQGYGSFPDSSCCSFTGNPIKRRASSLTVDSLYFSRRSVDFSSWVGWKALPC